MKHVLHKLVFLLAVFLVVLQGCYEPGNEVAPVTPNATVAPIQSVIPSPEGTTLKELVIKDGSAGHNILDTALEQVEWKLTNGEDVRPSKADLLLHTEIGSQGIVALKIPKSGQTQYNVVALAKTDSKWTITSVLDIPVFNLQKNKQGLALPFDQFEIGKQKIADSDIWAFASDTKLVLIGLYPAKIFTTPEGAENIAVNNHNAWLTTTTEGVPAIYYIENEKLVGITGNLSEVELKKLAMSLPSANAASFPAVNP
ncbi:hypothetical protein [Paenibacillus lutrae]|uniref:DUF4367 domain-containing protein n=1 Tax=Paenibacillus lutrae TaxID=2078573 RepID=A0A7X3FLQ4_9BACL|nr:hypothetical protein [Paenibacillus lutrae]MVP02084.1 hypothetical protein [Paenibacillus lutrae]